MIDFQAHDSYKNILGRVAKPYVNIDRVEEVNQGVKKNLIEVKRAHLRLSFLFKLFNLEAKRLLFSGF